MMPMREDTPNLDFLKRENLSPIAKLRLLTDNLVINTLGLCMKDEWWLDGPYQLDLPQEEDYDGEDAYFNAIEQEERSYNEYTAKT